MIFFASTSPGVCKGTPSGNMIFPPFFAAAVRINPAYFEAYDSWGIVALKQGRVDEAVAHFQAALQIKPDYAPARQHLERARSLLANGS